MSVKHLLLAAIALTLSGCHFIEEVNSNPAGPSGDKTPTATSAPTTAPTPTATPVATNPPPQEPTGEPTPAPLACPYGRGTGNGDICDRSTNGTYLTAVSASIQALKQQKPNWFIGNTVKTKFWDAYYAGVVANLTHRDGICAIVDHGGEIAVKGSNKFSEQFHILASSGDVHLGPTSYRATCKPAWF